MGRKDLGKVRFDEFVSNIYLPQVKIRKRSWKVDERIARQHLSPFFGASLLAKIKTMEVSQWLASLAAHPYAPATCNRILAVLRSILNMAVRYGFIANSPCASVAPFRVHNQRSEGLGVEDAKKIMKELEKSGHPHAPVLKLLLLTGARKSEILRAKWEYVDLNRKVLLVPLSKSGKPRVVYLCDEAIRIITKLPSSGKSPWLFPGRGSSKPLCDIYCFWNKTRCALGLQNIRIHDLRHTYASIMVNFGHTLYEVQRLLGHAEPKTTMRYAHLANDPLGEAAQTIGRLLAAEELAPNLPGAYCSILRWLASVPWASMAGILEQAEKRRQL